MVFFIFLLIVNFNCISSGIFPLKCLAISSSFHCMCLVFILLINRFIYLMSWLLLIYIPSVHFLLVLFTTILRRFCLWWPNKLFLFSLTVYFLPPFVPSSSDLLHYLMKRQSTIFSEVIFSVCPSYHHSNCYVLMSWQLSMFSECIFLPFLSFYPPQTQGSGRWRRPSRPRSAIPYALKFN